MDQSIISPNAQYVMQLNHKHQNIFNYYAGTIFGNQFEAHQELFKHTKNPSKW